MVDVYKIVDVLKMYYTDDTGLLKTYYKCICIRCRQKSDFLAMNNNNQTPLNSISGGYVPTSLDILKVSSDVVEKCLTSKNCFVSILYDRFGRIADIIKI